MRKADVLAVLDEVSSAGKLRTANVLLATLKQMFRFALAREIVDLNPLETLTKRDAGGKETERERTLSEWEIAELAGRLKTSRIQVESRAAIWIILSTGVRISELMNSQWTDLDFGNRTWHLPVTKNGRDHRIHLSDFALQQFDELVGLKESDPDRRSLPWVFPNSSGTGSVCVKSFGKQLSDRQRTAGTRLQGRSCQTQSLALPGGRWTPHDLRRTAATMMASLGVSGDVIDECLNHVIESRVRRTYIRNRRPEEQSRAFEALGERLADLTRRSLANTELLTT